MTCCPYPPSEGLKNSSTAGFRDSSSQLLSILIRLSDKRLDSGTDHSRKNCNDWNSREIWDFSVLFMDFSLFVGAASYEKLSTGPPNLCDGFLHKKLRQTGIVVPWGRDRSITAGFLLKISLLCDFLGHWSTLIFWPRHSIDPFFWVPAFHLAGVWLVRGTYPHTWKPFETVPRKMRPAFRGRASGPSIQKIPPEFILTKKASAKIKPRPKVQQLTTDHENRPRKGNFCEKESLQPALMPSESTEMHATNAWLAGLLECLILW